MKYTNKEVEFEKPEIPKTKTVWSEKRKKYVTIIRRKREITVTRSGW
jgi:hypothetical protein